MQTAYWVMVMMMVWITAPLSEGGKPNDVIRGLVPDDLTPQLILRSLISRRRSDKDVREGYKCVWKTCMPALWRRHDLKGKD
uniref:Consomatin Le1 n=2 Tax=Conus TaxID=6490 RepID=CSST1_CONLV|nr:RecName: Full=Consomatin Le1; Short=ConSST Le1; AltName: Full=Somatostatin-related peptide; Short=SSRP; Flags: Precursor [Conus lenavati]P0DQT5.1 RecName: Full=Consomatin Ro1; Short=ConSST Ro1; AltName: Full=Somatostatin-related peptide; Short=SSRP; Flags: Precursor [Conus rolani]QJF54072.1 Somatostatin-like peptide [Conus rolani]